MRERFNLISNFWPNPLSLEIVLLVRSSSEKEALQLKVTSPQNCKKRSRSTSGQEPNGKKPLCVCKSKDDDPIRATLCTSKNKWQ